MSSTIRPAPTLTKPNRREFLFYVGGASLALLAAGGCGLLARFLNPPLRGEKDGIFLLTHSEIPVLKSLPVYMRESNSYINWLDSGLIALDAYCTSHPSYRQSVRWVPTNYRFECPACGSKYQLDGTYIWGSAPRGLDRFTLEVTTNHGTITTSPDGSPISIEGATQILVDTNRVIYGKPRGG